MKHKCDVCIFHLKKVVTYKSKKGVCCFEEKPINFANEPICFSPTFLRRMKEIKSWKEIKSLLCFITSRRQSDTEISFFISSPKRSKLFFCFFLAIVISSLFVLMIYIFFIMSETIFCNPAKGRVDFEDGRLIKSSFITKDETKLVSQPGPKSHNKIFCNLSIQFKTHKLGLLIIFLSDNMLFSKQLHYYFAMSL